MKENNNSLFNYLVEQCLKGDEKAWDELIENVTPVIFSVCRSMRLTQVESFDIFGQVCYLLLKNLKNLKSPEKIISYVSTTTRREIMAIFRRTKLFEDVKSKDLINYQDETEIKTPEEIYDSAKKEEILMEAMLELPIKESLLIWHLFLDEDEPTYEEISLKIGIPIASIGPTRARCLLKLKTKLKSMGYKF